MPTIARAILTRLTRRTILAAPLAGLVFHAPATSPPYALQTSRSATLLVRGEAELAAESALGWRVVRDVAEPAPDAAFEQRALGLAVVTSPFTALLLTDRATGSAYRLAPGEASFVREGMFQRREVLGERPDSYLRIGLVAATVANDAGGDRLIFAGPAFASPGRHVTLALHRVEPASGEAVALPPGAGETLVLVEQGEVDLEIGEAALRERLRTVVGSDTAYAIRSVGPAAMLYGVADGTRILLATVA